MNKLFKSVLLLAGVGSLAFSVACGGGSSNGGGFGSGGGGGTGTFTVASLSGQYAYEIKGFSLTSGSAFRETGVFTADGAGHITSGVDDFALGTTISSDNTNGTYLISSDGTATLGLNFASGGTAAFAITLSSTSQFYMVETDSALSGLVASGTARKQDTSAFSSVPSGTYVLRMHTVSNAQGSTSSVGAFTIASGSVTGSMDRNRAGTVGSSTVTGTFNFPDATSGRGSGTFTDSSSGASTFIYYVVDASHLIFFSTDSGIIGTGEAEKQTGAPFTTASFSGPYAFGTSGDTANNLEGTNTVGRFAADGSGTITAGTLDGDEDGNTASSITFTGTYTVASTGRAAVTLNATSGTVQQIYWMVSPSRAFFITDSGSTVEDGSLDLQVGTFSNSSLSGMYAFNMTGLDTTLTSTKDRVGTINFSGSGTLSLTEVANAFGTVGQSSNLAGTYTVGNNGRATGSVTNLSSNLVFYMVSGNNAYILQNDTGVAISGSMIKQP